MGEYLFSDTSWHSLKKCAYQLGVSRTTYMRHVRLKWVEFKKVDWEASSSWQEELWWRWKDVHVLSFSGMLLSVVLCAYVCAQDETRGHTCMSSTTETHPQFYLLIWCKCLLEITSSLTSSLKPFKCPVPDTHTHTKPTRDPQICSLCSAHVSVFCVGLQHDYWWGGWSAYMTKYSLTKTPLVYAHFYFHSAWHIEDTFSGLP